MPFNLSPLAYTAFTCSFRPVSCRILVAPLVNAIHKTALPPRIMNNRGFSLSFSVRIYRKKCWKSNNVNSCFGSRKEITAWFRNFHHISRGIIYVIISQGAIIRRCIRELQRGCFVSESLFYHLNPILIQLSKKFLFSA